MSYLSLLISPLIFCSLVCASSTAIASPFATFQQSSSLRKAALLADAMTGEILFQDRADKVVDPASVVKLMVALITFEKLEKGTIALEDQLRVSNTVSRVEGHQVFLSTGEVFTLHEMLKAMIMKAVIA